MPSALGPQRGNKARTPPGRFRPRRPPGPAAVPPALLPRARPRVSRSPTAPAPRAPPPPPAPGRRCATCLQPGAHRARSAPGRRPRERGPVPCARRRPTPRVAPASTAWVAAGPQDEPGGLGYGTRLRTRGPQERQATRGTPCGCRSAGLWSENGPRSPSAQPVCGVRAARGNLVRGGLLAVRPRPAQAAPREGGRAERTAHTHLGAVAARRPRCSWSRGVYSRSGGGRPSFGRRAPHKPSRDSGHQRVRPAGGALLPPRTALVP